MSAKSSGLDSSATKKERRGDFSRKGLNVAKEAKLRQIHDAIYSGVIDAILTRKDALLTMDMYDLEKLSQVFPKAIVMNGCCLG